MSDVRITPGPECTYVIEVDGHDVSNLVNASQIDLAARQIPEVTLKLVPRQVAVTLTGADVRLDDETRTLLEALGWTPPRGWTPKEPPRDR